MVESFETNQSYLFAIAYRMLGNAMDAEDMVQETYLRYRATPPETIISLKAYLNTILTRLCVDQLQLARRKRELYMGPWLPEPLLTATTAGPANLEERVDEYESISLAFLLLLERLQPIERAVFLLREVFEYDYAEIASFLGKSEAACCQWLSRAKKHLADHRPRFLPSPDTHQQLLTVFFQAVEAGESHGMRNEFALRSRTGVRASFLALTCASSRRAVPHATAHDAVHGAFMTLPPYTRISEDEVHELGRGVRNGSHSARSRPLSKQSERIE